jgi:hypothetical protein
MFIQPLYGVQATSIINVAGYARSQFFQVHTAGNNSAVLAWARVQHIEITVSYLLHSILVYFQIGDPVFCIVLIH